MDEFYDEDEFEDDLIEAYCVRCRMSVEIEFPQAVWTRKGMPATRGDCPVCGGTVFRMGKTAMHSDSQRPTAVEVSGSSKRKQPKLSKDTVYVIYAEVDETIAQQIAADLEKSGVQPWLHEHNADQVAWAGGVHPALKDCARMLYVLSPAALSETSVVAGWKFFKENRKPIVIAQIAAAEPPDAIRRSPRFDFTGDYRRAFREMVQALG